MPIGDMPILEVVLRQLRPPGSRSDHGGGLSCGAVAGLFGHGERLGLEIDYSFEDRPLGTVGPIDADSDLADEDVFLLMNGDILCTMDYTALIRHHLESGAAATISTFRRK